MSTQAIPAVSLDRRAARLREIILETVSEDDMTAIVNKLIELAKEGDLSAIRLLFKHTLGKPVECAAPPRNGPPIDALTELIPPGSATGEKLGEMIREELSRSADTKRPQTANKKPISDTRGQPFASTETMRLVNLS